MNFDMSDELQGWERRDKPPTLYRRFSFERYAQTRAFLDALSVLCDEFKRHPQNISFGTTYVNVTLEPTDDKVFASQDETFAARISALAEQGK
ncbi:4a-hydroxytetrahydrobiopterin dehydratase [Nitrosomonas eutropha]|uniref:4a-hydroxytetrahydrobiopterin dehydratase n=2 Tax=Nitrosomonadaceae TaxID=206379 RepID=UPI000AFAA019|nr:4a-hydroxytetrahydrobiopterin dehydratase [Nitrosomonas eutropha]MXS81016.1 4a-hydroxytetrahydrobiopterin dehydratase [Nitrosomonas sp. GH22]